MEKEEALQDAKSRETNLNNKVTSLENQLSAINNQLEQTTQQHGANQQTISSLNTAQSDLSKKLSSQQEAHSKAVKEVSVFKSGL